MIAKQAIYLNLERDKALPEGHEDAKFLLVRGGQEIADAELGKFDGASELAESEAEEKEMPPIPAPNLKEHGQEEGGRAIPAPKVKNAADKDDESAKPEKAAVPVAPKKKAVRAPKKKSARKK